MIRVSVRLLLMGSELDFKIIGGGLLQQYYSVWDQANDGMGLQRAVSDKVQGL